MRGLAGLILVVSGCAAGGDAQPTSASWTAGSGTPSDASTGDATGDEASTGSSSSSSGTPEIGSSSTGAPPVGECGDAVATPDEACDLDDLGGQTCADFGFQEGALLCGPDCELITEGCRTCGDGMMALSEPCDGVLLGGETCLTQGFGGGTLACAADCTAFDTSACTPLASCGNGAIDGMEQCDGADLGGSSCQTLGFDFGVLSCSAGSCTFDTDGCEYNDCAGNGDFCLFDPDDPQSNCCPAGVGGNDFGICAFFVCT